MAVGDTTGRLGRQLPPTRPASSSGNRRLHWRLLGVALPLLWLAAACGGGQAPGAAIVQIRNLMSAPVAVEITEPYSGTVTHGVPSWHQGACSQGFGTAPGNVSVVVSGPLVQGTPTDQVVVPATPQTWVTVTIQSDGTVTFGSTELNDGTCSTQDEVPPPSGY